ALVPTTAIRLYTPSLTTLFRSHTPRAPSRALRAWACSRHRASGTMMLSLLGTPSREAPLSSRCQLSVTTWSFLMIRCIDALLEGLDADTAEGIDEALVLGALFEVDTDDLLDDVGHVVLGERRAEDLPQAGVANGTAAQGYLVELRALLVYAENADMAHVMVAAGVHAAGDIQVQLAQVEQVVQVIEAALDGLGHRDGLGIGQRAVVAT